MKTLFLQSHNEELRRILVWPNHPEHPTRWTLEKIAAEEVKTRSTRDGLKADLAKVGGWNDNMQNDPVVGVLMGKVSAWNSLLTELHHAQRWVQQNHEAPV